MAKSVGNMLVELSANWAQFEQGVGRAASLLESQAARMNATLAGIEKSFGRLNVVGGTFITGYVLNMGREAVKANAQFGASIKEMSENLGLSTDAAQELEFAIRKGGATSEQSSAMMSTFVKTVGDARDGVQSAQEALAKLSITTDDLRGKDMEGLFVQATSALAGFENVSDRNSRAVGAFGKQAKANADALAISTANMREFRAEAVATGQVMDSSGVEKSKALTLQFEASARALQISWGPALLAAGELLVKFGNLMMQTTNMVRTFAEDLGLLNATEGAREYDKLLRERTTLMDQLAVAENNVAASDPFGMPMQDARSLSMAIDAVDQKLAALRKKDNDARAAAKPADQQQGSKTGPLFMSKEGQSEIEALAKKRLEIEAQLSEDAATKAQFRLKADDGEVKTKLKNLGLWVEAGKSATAEQQKAMDAYYSWLEERQKQAARESESALDKQAREWQNATKQMQDATAEWAKGGMDALTAFVKTGKLDFKSLADSVITDIIRINLQKGIGNAVSGAAGWLGSVIGLPAFAQGGDFPAGGPILVGEQGPEIVVPAAAGRVIPSTGLSSGGMSTNVSVTVDARGSQVEGDDAQSWRLGNTLANAVRGVLMQEKRPGGLLAT
jgi:hypothetical protein